MYVSSLVQGSGHVPGTECKQSRLLRESLQAG